MPDVPVYRTPVALLPETALDHRGDFESLRTGTLGQITLRDQRDFAILARVAP